MAVAVLAQVAIAIGMHWNLIPRAMARFGQQDALSYLLYLVGGCVVAFHLDQVHAWVCAHARLIAALTVASALAAEGVYFLAAYGVTDVLGSGSDPFQPSLIPFNVGAVTGGYLAGVALVRPGRSRRIAAMVRSGADNAYGIYLSHMLFITALTWAGWGKLSSVIPWPVLCLVTVVIVLAAAMTLTAVLARTPLAVSLTGRARVPWRRGRAPAAAPAAAGARGGRRGRGGGSARPHGNPGQGGEPAGERRPGNQPRMTGVRVRHAPVLPFRHFGEGAQADDGLVPAQLAGP